MAYYCNKVAAVLFEDSLRQVIHSCHSLDHSQRLSPLFEPDYHSQLPEDLRKSTALRIVKPFFCSIIRSFIQLFERSQK